MKIMQCAHCGNQVFVLNDGGVPMVCCGEEMQALVAGSTDAAQEKHVPAIRVEGSTLQVTVGEVAHPMLAEHFIQWIAVEQGDKVQFARLKPEQAPEATFTIEPGKAFAVYEYCNLHGLWKAEGQA
ncbi:desulfoferrodoxin [Ruminococcaceae bacterium OttesenSCG-928-A11]|nr:desulfoferrodoxin [Ruminococcaceae bacterium OttesenSCG-928-A11]